MNLIARLLKFFRILMILVAVSGCPGPRYHELELQLEQTQKDLAELESTISAQALRSESVVVGLERLETRLDWVTPSSAQWLKLQPTSTIKWYVNKDAQNIYVQCLDYDAVTRGVGISIITRTGMIEELLHPEEVVEIAWQDGDKSITVIIAFHRLLHRNDGTIWGLFSLMQGPIPGL